MNKVLTEILDKTTVKFSENVVTGLAPKVYDRLPKTLNNIIVDSIKSLNPIVDLKYLGYRRLTPKEEFIKMYKSTTNKTNFDLARSDLYTIELMFEYEGQPLNRVLLLPYVNPNNVMYISNTPYHIVPVLSDTVVSPSHKEVFVRLLKDKITFKNIVRNFIVNGEKVHGQVVYAPIMFVNEKQITDNIGKPLLASALYLVGKYGIRETLKRYCGIDEVIVTEEEAVSFRDEYLVFESSNIKPRGLKEYGYNGHKVKFIVPKKHNNSTLVNNIMYGLIYTLDILPDNAHELVDVINNGELEDEKLFWRIMIGRITYKNSYSVDRIIQDTMDHFNSLEGYIDSYIKNKLRENGIMVNNFFDLVAVILDKYNALIMNSKEYNSDINNRYIDIDYYLLHDIFVGFNKVILNINRRATKKRLTHAEVSKNFANELSTRRIYSLVKSSAVNLSIMLADTTTDIKYPKTTAPLEDRIGLFIVLLLIVISIIIATI